MLKISYFDRDQNKQIVLEVNAAQDVVAISVPTLDDQPPLKIHVNTDAVIVNFDDGRTGSQLLASYDYSNMLAALDDGDAVGDFSAPQNVCPSCKSDNIENHDAADDGRLFVTCGECGYQWHEPCPDEDKDEIDPWELVVTFKKDVTPAQLEKLNAYMALRKMAAGRQDDTESVTYTLESETTGYLIAPDLEEDKAWKKLIDDVTVQGPE